MCFKREKVKRIPQSLCKMMSQTVTMAEELEVEEMPAEVVPKEEEDLKRLMSSNNMINQTEITEA